MLPVGPPGNVTTGGNPSDGCRATSVLVMPRATWGPRTSTLSAIFCAMSASESRLQQRPLDGGGVAVCGDIDAGTSAEFESFLTGADGNPVTTIDMSGVTFMDSSGLRVLIAHHQRLGGEGRSPRIVEPSRSVHRLFEITGLIDELNVVVA